MPHTSRTDLPDEPLQGETAPRVTTVAGLGQPPATASGNTSTRICTNCKRTFSTGAALSNHVKSCNKRGHTRPGQSEGTPTKKTLTQNNAALPTESVHIERPGNYLFSLFDSSLYTCGFFVLPRCGLFSFSWVNVA